MNVSLLDRKMKQATSRLPILVGLIYFFTAWAWFALSDRILLKFFPASTSFATIDISKGVAFGSVSALTLYFTLRGQLRRRERETIALKHAQAVLQEREEQQRLFVEHSPAAIAMFDRNMKYLMVSPRWIEDYQLGGQTIIGRSHYEVFPKMPAEWRDIHQRCLAGEVVSREEESFIRFDGTTGWIRWEIRPWRQSDDAVGGIIIFSEDITSRKQTETALKLFRTLIERSNDQIFVIDPHSGRFLDANQSGWRSLGYTSDELMALTIWDVVPGLSRAQFEADREKMNRSGHALIESLHRRKDGSTYPVEVSLSPVQVDREYVMAMVHDITERKLAEATLRASEENFRLLMANTSDIVSVISGEGIFRFHSPSVEKVLGYRPEELLNRASVEFIHPEDLPAIRRSLRRILAEPGTPVSSEFRFRHRDGSWRRLQSISKSVPGQLAEGFIVISSRDVTEQRKLEEQFRQAQKLEGIGQLAGGVAHDFNNILAVIQMQADLLICNGDLSDKQAQSVEEIAATVQRASALTRQLLLFSRREVVQPRDFDLNDSIASTTKMLKRLVGENVRMRLELAPKPMFIHADAGMMDQVLMNLVVNARDAMPDGGQLIVETSAAEGDESMIAQSPQARPGSFIRLSVSDSGSGIAPDVLPRIFEPFFTTKGVGKGTGLGLATVFGIVQQHQGWVQVQSEVGRGTTFHVYLPRLANVRLPEEAAGSHPGSRHGHETILLAEDDPTLRASVRWALHQLGYQILEAPSGVKALELWNERRGEIKLLLTDLMMPDGMSGKELGRRLLQDNKRLKVIYMSGYSPEIAGDDFPLEEGVNFLPKPFPATKLAQIIRNSLESPN